MKPVQDPPLLTLDTADTPHGFAVLGAAVLSSLQTQGCAVIRVEEGVIYREEVEEVQTLDEEYLLVPLRDMEDGGRVSLERALRLPSLLLVLCKSPDSMWHKKSEPPPKDTNR